GYAFCLASVFCRGPPPRLSLFPYTTLFRSDVDDGLDLRVDGRHVERRAAQERVLHHFSQRRNLRLQHLGHERLDQGLTDGVTNRDRKSTRLNSSHVKISYAVFCLKKKKKRN